MSVETDQIDAGKFLETIRNNHGEPARPSVERIEDSLFPLANPINEVDLMELGREVDDDQTRDGFERQGRPLTNLEMVARMKFRDDDNRRKADEILNEL